MLSLTSKFDGIAQCLLLQAHSKCYTLKTYAENIMFSNHHDDILTCIH